MKIGNIICESIKESKVGYHVNDYREKGDLWITVENVCLVKPASSSRSYLSIHINSLELDRLFVYGPYFDLTLADEEVTFYWPESDGVWLFGGWCSALFIRWDNFMLYKIFGDKYYPPVKDIIFDSYLINLEDNEMHRLYHKIYTSKYENVRKYYSQDMSKYFRKYGHVCFKKVHIMYRSGYNGFFFVDRSMRINFRDDGYRITGVNRINGNKINDDDNNGKVIEIGVIIRKNSNRKREIINLKEVLSLLKDLEAKSKYRIKYEVIYFDKKSAREQVQLIMNKQIIISPHGAGLCNILWILSEKAVIIECYSIFRTDAYVKLSVMMNYRYFPLPSPYFNGFDFIIKSDEVEYNFDEYPYIHHTRYDYHPLKYFASADIIVSMKQVLFSLILSFHDFNL